MTLEEIIIARLEEINERLKAIEARVSLGPFVNYPPVYGPIPVTCGRMVWDEAADEALRNFEKQVGQ